MKRRSPWLAFAACALLRGSPVQAELGEKPAAAPEKQAAFEKPLLSISAASTAAEGELKKRGLGVQHMITSVSLVRIYGQPDYYVAKIQPPVTPDGKALPAFDAPDAPASSILVFNVAMNGAVTASEQTLPRRGPVFNQTPK